MSGGGVNDSFISHLNLKAKDVMVLDTFSFPRDASSVPKTDDMGIKTGMFGSSIFRFYKKELTEEEKSLLLKALLTGITKVEKIQAIEQRYIQFGSFSSGLLYPLIITGKSNKRSKTLKRPAFVTPDKVPLIKQTTIAIENKLGGSRKYKEININFSAQIQKKLRDPIEPEAFKDDGEPAKTGREYLNKLSRKLQEESVEFTAQQMNKKTPQILSS